MLDMIEMSYDKIITTRLQANRIVHDFALFARKINLFLVHELYSVNLRQKIKISPSQTLKTVLIQYQINHVK